MLGDAEPAFEIVFAVGVFLAAASLAGAALERAGRRSSGRGRRGRDSCDSGLGRVRARSVSSSRSRPPASWRASWPRRRAGASPGLARAGIDGTSSGPKAELDGVAQRDLRRSGELERTLARARADSLSAYAEEERRLAETRRTALGESEQRLRHGLAEAFSKVQGQVEQRLASWHQDLDRAQRQLGARLEQIAHRERSLIEALEARLENDGERVKTADDEQKAAVEPAAGGSCPDGGGGRRECAGRARDPRGRAQARPPSGGRADDGPGTRSPAEGRARGD